MTKLTITPEQQTTHDLFEKYLANHWSTNNQSVANVFNSHWTAAFSEEQIGKIIDALYGFNPVNLDATLNELVRSRVLRTRRNNGRKLYEVRY